MPQVAVWPCTQLRSCTQHSALGQITQIHATPLDYEQTVACVSHKHSSAHLTVRSQALQPTFQAVKEKVLPAEPILMLRGCMPGRLRRLTCWLPLKTRCSYTSSHTA